MENFLIYLLKASIGILLFYLIYHLILRKETYYVSNRIYLILGLLLAMLLPAFPISYTSSIPMVNNSEFFTLGERSISNILPVSPGDSAMTLAWSDPIFILSLIYIVGAGFFLLRLVFQTLFVAIQLRRGTKMRMDGVAVVDIKRDIMPFSFFNTVIINLQEYAKEELSKIIAHEKVHIQERHWVDLLIIELLTVVFWMHPIVWLYEKSIKQNHEYLADQGVLLAGYHPGQYQALLINQLMGVKIMGFTNNLNFSLNKKRMEMMKKEKSSQLMRAKLLILLPIVAMLVFAFAKPEYVMVDGNSNSPQDQVAIDEKEMILVKGTVKDENGRPLPGANIIRKGSNDGTVSDIDGTFEIEVPKLDKQMSGTIDKNRVPQHEVHNANTLVISYVGFKTYAIAFDSREERKEPFTIKMTKGIFNIELPEVTSEEKLVRDPPPPPPPKKKEGEDVWTIVEEMPHYSNGGMPKLSWDIFKEAEAVMDKTKDRGSTVVGFTLTSAGKVANAYIVESAGSKLLDTSALKIVQKLDNWIPGNQRGKRVAVDLTVPVKFN